jgi:acyl-coenzyme A synthetase/AMP-(fatty) acid ligase
VVTLRPGESIDAEEVLRKVRGKLSPFKCPKAILVVEAMPKTATGKIQKAQVRKNFVGHFQVQDKSA